MSKMSFLRPEIEKRRLIELVRSNPILWDCRLPHYKRSDKKKALKWNELGRIFSVSGERLQRTFTSLREIFRREFNNEKLLGNSFASKWEYYDAMAFLKGVIRERKSRERLKSFPNQHNGGGSLENVQNIIDEYQYFAPNDPNNPNNLNQIILQQQQSSILKNQLENTFTKTTTIMPILIKQNNSQIEKHNNENEQNIIDEYQYFSPSDPNNPNNFNQLEIQLKQQQQQPKEPNKKLSTIFQSNLEKTTATPTTIVAMTTTTTTSTTSTNTINTPIIQIEQHLSSKSQLENYHDTNCEQNRILTHNSVQHNKNENPLNGLQTLSNVSAKQSPLIQLSSTNQLEQYQLLPKNINTNNQSSNQERTSVRETTAIKSSSVESITNITSNDINTLRSSSSSPSIYIKSEIDSQDEESIDDIDGLTEPSLDSESNNNNNNNNNSKNHNIMYNLQITPNLQLQQQPHQKINSKISNNGIIASLENDSNQSHRSLEQKGNGNSIYAPRSATTTTNNVQSQNHRKPNSNNNNNSHINRKSLGPSINNNNFVTDMHIDLDMDEDVDADMEDINNGERYSINSNLTTGPIGGQQAPSSREVLFSRFADFLAARLNTLSEQVAHDLMNNILMLIAEQ